MNSSPLPPQAAYLRVASLSVGLYDYICTLPAEYRFYKAQRSFRNISQSCILFILIRYISIAVLTISNVGFFANDFSRVVCSHYFIISPIFKVLQAIVCQTSFEQNDFRSYSISKRALWVKWTMVCLSGITIPLLFFSNLYQRSPVRDKGTNDCSSGNRTQQKIAWLFYIIIMIYDLVVVGISTGYLWYYSATGTRMSQFMKTLLYEGMGYLVVLTAINIFNLVLYRSNVVDLQTSGSSLGFVAVWVMSQKILIHQRNASEKYASSENLSDNSYIVHTQSLDTSREINHALRSQFETAKTQKSSTSKFTNIMRLSSQNETTTDEESQVHVEVRVEKRVQVRYDPEALERENYRKTRTLQASRSVETR